MAAVAADVKILMRKMERRICSKTSSRRGYSKFLFSGICLSTPPGKLLRGSLLLLVFMNVLDSGDCNPVNKALGKPTNQQSTSESYQASKAVDGNMETTLTGAYGCTMTLKQYDVWWSVDLETSVDVSFVRLTNRADCCGERLANFYIGITDVSPLTTTPTWNPPNYSVCRHYVGEFPYGASAYVGCDAITSGRYVIIQLTVREHLTLCEVEVFEAYNFTNRALGGATAEGSHLDVSYTGSWHAADGFAGAIDSESACFRSDGLGEAWWSVDMGIHMQVFSVSITAMEICIFDCVEKTVNFNVGVTDDSPTTVTPALNPLTYAICATYPGQLPYNQVTTINCAAGVHGTYVIIQLGGSGRLNFCEVSVSAETDECEINPCVHGSCTDLDQDFDCACDAGYTGKTCAEEIDECSSTPCAHGSCADHVASYTCTCDPGYEGTLCAQDINECASNPCVHGQCVDAVNGFTCDCEGVFTGVLCESDIDECDSEPCANGATCLNDVGSVTCTCAEGWTGQWCTLSVDECVSSPCNSGSCVDAHLGYTCTCDSGFSGTHCDEDYDECQSGPCAHGDCEDGANEYTCICDGGYTGTNCDVELDECDSDPCVNGTCEDHVNRFTCTCFEGYGGRICDREVNICDSQPCSHGWCRNFVTYYICNCYGGWEGTHCEIPIDECLSDPCLEGTCIDQNNRFLCDCTSGYTGDQCESEFDECTSDPCQNGGNCTDHFDAYTCACLPGFTGVNCETDLDECLSTPCVHGTCLDEPGAYNCSCVAGYSGTDCEAEIDECTSSPCNSGTCVDELDFFTCNCEEGHTGEFCETVITPCYSAPCTNGGTCISDPNSYTCLCADGYTGQICDADINECDSNPCVHGNCNDLMAAYSCSCQSGYAGTNCDQDINECSSNPCVQGACTDGVNRFTCSCNPGWMGTRCGSNINECGSNPCVHGNCVDQTNKYVCNCNGGFQGTHCDQDINECASSPCMHGTCTNNVNAFSCTCETWYKGVRCHLDIYACDSNPCQYGGTCVEGYRDYVCNCLPGYTGILCEQDIDECLSAPCLHGSCVDHPNAFSCTCDEGYTGVICDTVITNMALLKSTGQSSTWPPYESSYAVDDLYTTDLAQGCTKTARQYNPYWYVDLEETMVVNNIWITNRGDCCGETLSNFLVGVTDTSPASQVPAVDPVNYPLCAHYVGEFPHGGRAMLSCDGVISGRYVIVQLQVRSELYLCEVEVYTSLQIENKALGHPTNQGTVMDDSYTGSWHAVDGYYGLRASKADCFRSQVSSQTWWSVDLEDYGEHRLVSSVRVTSVGTCAVDCDEPMENFYVGVSQVSPGTLTPDPAGPSYEVCAHYTGTFPTGHTEDFDCPEPLNGSHVIIQLIGSGRLELCEVEVYSEYDACHVVPCGFGTCQDVRNDSSVDGFSCDCLGLYVEPHCQIEIDECDSNPCLYGNCTDQLGGYVCDCHPGYNGTHCEYDINECLSDPCVNGNCLDLVDAFLCNCSDYRWGGIFCEIGETSKFRG